MTSIIEKLKQIASEKSNGDEPIVLSREDMREVTGLPTGSNLKCYKTLLEQALRENGVNIGFAKRGFPNKKRNPPPSETEATEDGLFIPLEELEKVDIKEGDRLKVQYKKGTTITRKGKTTFKQGSLIIEKISGKEDRFIPSEQNDEDHYAEEETSEEEDMLDA